MKIRRGYFETFCNKQTKMTSKSEYLKRYLSDTKGEKKRKKRQATKSTQSKTRFRIVEDDTDIPHLPGPSEAEKIEEAISDEDEIKPVVALVNNMTDELKLLGKFQTANWTAIQHEEITAGISARVRRDSDDQSPPRQRGNLAVGESSPRRRRHSSNDMSPPRKRHDSGDVSPVRRRRNSTDDEDPNPPRRRRGSNDLSPVRLRPTSTDRSPPRRRQPSPSTHRRGSRDITGCRSTTAGRNWSTSPPIRGSSGAPSPPRHDRSPTSIKSATRRRHDSDESPPRLGQQSGERRRYSRDQESSPTHLDAAGRSGDSMKPVKRNIRRKEPTEEQKKRKEEMERKYAVWNKGQKQVQDREQKLADLAAEASKPFARHAGDEDVEEHLKNIEYNEDPMLEYMREKKQKETGSVSKPKYQGPWPSNRYGIPPGYRWDGVDRSNGFEEKLMASKNIKKAEEEEYYKWSSGRFE